MWIIDTGGVIVEIVTAAAGIDTVGILSVKITEQTLRTEDGRALNAQRVAHVYHY
jgi:hypothetical protein